MSVAGITGLLVIRRTDPPDLGIASGSAATGLFHLERQSERTKHGKQPPRKLPVTGSIPGRCRLVLPPVLLPHQCAVSAYRSGGKGSVGSIHWKGLVGRCVLSCRIFILREAVFFVQCIARLGRCARWSLCGFCGVAVPLSSIVTWWLHLVTPRGTSRALSVILGGDKGGSVGFRVLFCRHFVRYGGQVNAERGASGAFGTLSPRPPPTSGSPRRTRGSSVSSKYSRLSPAGC